MKKLIKHIIKFIIVSVLFIVGLFVFTVAPITSIALVTFAVGFGIYSGFKLIKDFDKWFESIPVRRKERRAHRRNQRIARKRDKFLTEKKKIAYQIHIEEQCDQIIKLRYSHSYFDSIRSKESKYDDKLTKKNRKLGKKEQKKAKNKAPVKIK